MTRKGKSIIREVLNRIKWFENPEEYIVTILHRSVDGEIGSIEIKASNIVEVGSWYIRLSDRIIPFHRILEIRKVDGGIIWRKGCKSARFQ